MTPPNARELAIKILREHIPIEPNEDCDKEINRVTDLLREAMEQVELKAKASSEHELQLAYRIVDGVKEVNDHIQDVAREARVEALTQAAQAHQNDCNVFLDDEGDWVLTDYQSCTCDRTKAILALIPHLPKKEQETENK